MDVVFGILFAIVFILIGMKIGCVYCKSKKPVIDGTLKYSVDPDDGVYFFLEFPNENGPASVLRKKYATFEVDTSDILSHD